MATHVKEGLYYDHYPTYMFFPFAIKVLGVFTNNSIIFFIDVRTWHGHERPLEAFIYQGCILFIDKECQWSANHLHIKVGCYCKGGFF